MKLECHTHSDPASNPPRHYVDGVRVTSDAYWDAFDAHWSPERGYHHAMIDRDEANSQRSRITTMILN